MQKVCASFFTCGVHSWRSHILNISGAQDVLVKISLAETIHSLVGQSVREGLACDGCWREAMSACSSGLRAHSSS